MQQVGPEVAAWREGGEQGRISPPGPKNPFEAGLGPPPAPRELPHRAAGSHMMPKWGQSPVSAVTLPSEQRLQALGAEGLEVKLLLGRCPQHLLLSLHTRRANGCI